MDLHKVQFLAKLESNHNPDLLSLSFSQCSHTLPDLHSNTIDAYTKSTSVIAYTFIYKIPRKHKLPLLPVCSSEV